MASIFKRTKLWSLVQEACAEHSALRRSQFRHALKVRRIVLKLRIIAEMHRSRMDKIREEMAIANAAARVEVIRNVGEAERNRRVQLEAIAREKGHNLVLAKPDGNSGDIKKEIAQKVMELVPDDARGVTAGPLVEGLLQDSLQKLDLDPRKTREELSIDLVFSLAQQAGVSSEKLKDMLMKMGNSWDVTENRHPLNKIISRLKQQEDRSKQ